MRKQRSRSWKVALVGLFTTAAAPVLVHFLGASNLSAGSNSLHEDLAAASPAAATAASFPSKAPKEITVVAQGTGWTADLAWDNALHKALRSAVETVGDGSPRAEDSARMMAVATSCMRGCEELHCVKEWGGWRREIAVSIDRDVLAEKLKAGSVRVAMGRP